MDRISTQFGCLKAEQSSVLARWQNNLTVPFAHLKRILGLGRLRLRGPCGAKDEFLLAATAQTREATDLTRRSARLKEIAPKLRAKGSDQALALLVSQDAVAPTALTSLRSDRAARRFCDRLVELGGVRELTRRDTFRLYGI